MSIGERATHVLSMLLVVAVATTSVGWTVAVRHGAPCMRPSHQCTPVASLTCRCHTLPRTPDTARLPEIAPPQVTPSHASLMDLATASAGARAPIVGVTSRHALQHLDRAVLNHTFLI
jgi:hypothetical protein